MADEIAAAQTALLWVARTGPVLRGLTHRFGNGLHALSLVSGGHDEGLDAEDVSLLRDELQGFERLTEQYRALVLALEEEPSAWRMEDALTVAIGLRGAHVQVRDAELVPVYDGELPAVLVPPTALAQSLLILLLGDTPDGDQVPRVTVRGSEHAAYLEIRGAHANGRDEAAERAVHWLLRRVVPSVELLWTDDAGESVLTLTLPALRVSRRAIAAQE